MHPFARIPGFVIIILVGSAIIAYGITLPELNPNWVIGIGVLILIIAVLSITVAR